MPTPSSLTSILHSPAAWTAAIRNAFRAFIDELLAGPEPELDSIGAVEAVRELRVDADA